MVAVALVICLLLTSFSALAATDSFTDVQSDDWFYNEVVWAKEQGLMKGTADDVFSPETAIDRAMFVTILWRLEGEPAVDGELQFEDVKEDTWYTEAVRWAAAEKIVQGMSETTFVPEDACTREQMVTLLYRYAEYKELDVSAEETELAFSDAADLGDWAEKAMQWACEAGVVKGYEDNTLKPQNDASRAQAATIFFRFCEIYAEELSHVHEYTWTANGDGTHTGACICGKKLTGDCDYNYAPDSESDTHTVACSVCGDSHQEEHNYVKGTCTDCAAPHACVYEYSAENDKIHTGTCACGQTISGGHVMNAKDICIFCEYHTHQAVNERTTHVYNDDTMTHLAVCICDGEDDGAKIADDCTYDTTKLPEKADGYYNYTCTVCNGVYKTKELMIFSKEQLLAFAADVNSGNAYSGVTVKLMKEIDLDGVNWTPIDSFCGTFDGQNNIIRNLSCTGTSCVGLFGSVTGKVTQVVLVDASITGNHYVGGIAGYVYGTVTDCTVKNSTIKCLPAPEGEGYNDGDKAGGIVGYLPAEPRSVISGCTVENVQVTAYRDVGGITGMVNTGEGNCAATVSGNTVTGVTVTVDQNVTGYLGSTTPNGGVVVGRIDAVDQEKITVENNTVDETTKVIVKLGE